MLEFLSSGIFGGLLGGVFRLAPEVLKWLDKKNEREHEFKMFDRQADLELKRGQMKLQEVGIQTTADVDRGVVDAFKAAIDQQTEMVKAAKGWWGEFAAAMSALVRPGTTYYLALLYGTVKACLVFAAWANKVPLTDAIPMVYGKDDVAMFWGVLNYWFMDRTLQRRGL